MTLELSEIKTIRKKLDLTQSELANHAQVSQSLIAKIEADQLDPTYTNAQKIFNALNELSKKEEVTAEQMMQHKIIHVTPGLSIKDAIKKLKKHEISQMPVLEKGNVKGMISESSILDAILEGKDDKKVIDVMQDAPPIIAKDTTIDVVSNLLKFYPVVLVSEKGKLKGTIAKIDMIKTIYK
jgi:predicted transcriptional regulator